MTLQYLNLIADVILALGLFATWRKLTAVSTSYVYWYARCDGHARLGIFRTEVEAWDAVMDSHGYPRPNAIVWSEYINLKLSQRFRISGKKVHAS